MKRKIIKINEEKCNGCGNCIPACPEGAMQVIDGKARLISDLFCDGLGACMGHCPEGAMEVEEREAEAYDEIKVMQNIVKQGNNVIKAHLLHLKDHGDTEHYNEACEYLKENGIVLKEEGKGMSEHKHFGGCPGARTMSFDKSKVEADSDEGGKRSSQLRQWPIQLHLVSPQAPYFQKSDVLLAADCVAFSLGDFHKDYLKGKSLIIACPKLDSELEVYAEKLKNMINDAKINTLTVMIMEVPCCGGLLQIAKEALNKAERKIPIKKIKVSLKGDILEEDWV